MHEKDRAADDVSVIGLSLKVRHCTRNRLCFQANGLKSSRNDIAGEMVDCWCINAGPNGSNIACGDANT